MPRASLNRRLIGQRSRCANALSLLTALACALTLALLPTSPSAAANSCVVTTLDDSGDGSLRAALADANCTAISFQSGLTGTIALQSSLPVITRDLALKGPGAANLAISAN